MHHIVDAVIDDGEVVIAGQLPDIERRDEEDRGDRRIGEDAEDPADDAVGDDRLEEIRADRRPQSGTQNPLRPGERDQHRPGHAQQQMLDLMHPEQTLGDRIDRRLQGEEDGRQAAKERRMTPSR